MKRIQNSLIVSCQALEDEPLHSSLIMSKMALAAKMGGAKGIRANSVQDIHEIKKEVDLPIIGIIKKDYEDTDIYITTTMKEVDALVAEGVDIIAMDATMQLRPHNQTITEFFKEVKAKNPHQLFMADCSTVEEAIHADNIGFDFIGTTLVGYTPQSQNSRIDANDFKIIREIVKNVKHPVIGEGNIDTPSKVKRALELGCYSVFVGEGHYFDQWFGAPCNDFAKIGSVISSASMSIMAILLVFTTAKALANEYKMDTSVAGATAVVCFLCLTPFVSDAKIGEYVTTYYLGAAGMFTAFISALISVELMRFLLGFKALVIKMPESVPTGIARSFNAIIPVALTVIIFAILRIITDAIGAPLNDLIFNWIQTPFTAIVSSPVGLIVIYVLYMLLWGFGIHSAYIFNPILEPIYLASLAINEAAITSGTAATEIITKPFIDSVAFMGGAGNMLALVIAIFIVSKRDDYKVIGKLGFVPALFNISEPLMFGLPVVMNPILIIPMILTTLAGLGIGALATQIGIMAHTYVLIPWTTPPVISAFLATGGDIMSGVIGLLILVVSVLIYIPFVKVMNKEGIESIEE